MPTKLTRQQIYSLVWAQPTRSVAASLGVSDVALAKTCKKADIPIPPRGYWARKPEDQRLLKMPLRPRFPGAPDEFEIGADSRQYWRTYSEQELVEMVIPPAPEFPEPMEAVQARIETIVGKVPAQKNFDKAFGDVSRLLRHDDERRNSQWSFEKPKYDGGIERRRLLLLNSLFLGLYAAGCKTSMSTSKWRTEDLESRAVCVTAGTQHVYFMLEPIGAGRRRGPVIEDLKAQLRLALGSPHSNTPPVTFWEDTDESRLETRLREIVVALMVEAEKAHRDAAVRHREWLIERKSAVLKKIEQEKAEQKRRELELEAKRKKERVEALLRQASDMQKAQLIRNYVRGLQGRSAEISTTPAELARWATWALAEADRIDPAKSLQFLDMMPAAI